MSVNVSFDGPIFWNRQVIYIYCCSCHFDEKHEVGSLILNTFILSLKSWKFSMKIISTYPSREISIEIIFGANLIMHSINIKHFPHSVKVYSCNAHSIEKGSRGEIRELEPPAFCLSFAWSVGF